MEQLLCKIKDINRAIIQFEDQLRGEFGISLNEGMLLCALNRCDVSSASQCAELLSLTPSNMSKVIKGAEANGYISRHLGIEDKRTMYFQITEKGKALMHRIDHWDIVVPDLLK